MLDKSSPAKVATLTVVTFGFYYFYWCLKSKQAIHAAAKQELVPTNWLLAVPGGNYWWMWHYSRALEHVSFKRIKGNDTFLLYFLLTSGGWIFGQLLSSFVDNNNDGNLKHTDFVLLCVFSSLIIVSMIIGLAVFCAVIQAKINKISADSSK